MFKQKIKQVTDKIPKVVNDQSFIISILFIFFIVALYKFAFFIGNNSVDFPFWDQWGTANILTGAEKSNLFQILFYQHNEHRIGVGLLIIKILANSSNWSQLLEIKFVSLLITSSSLLIMGVKYFISKKFEILDLIIPLIILNIFQFENLIWGFQIAFVLPLFLFCLWIYALLKIKSAQWRYGALIILSVLSSFSSFHGLILPILTIILGIIEYYKHRSISVKLIWLVLLANISIIALYFINYTSNFQTKLSIIPTWEMVKYFSAAISNGFFFNANNTFINILIACTVVLLFIIGVFKFIQNKKEDNHTLVGCLLLAYSIIFIGIIAMGRSAFGIEQAFSSRYVTFSMLTPLGLFFIFSSITHGKYLKIILLIFVVSNSIFLSSGVIHSHMYNVTPKKQRALTCYTVSPIEEWSTCFKIFSFYPNEDYLNQRLLKTLEYKRAGNNSPFSTHTPINSKLNVAEKCEGSIDIINNLTPIPQNITVSGVLEISGWLVPSLDTANTAKDTYVVLTNERNENTFFPTHKSYRPDVGIHFKDEKLNNSGFEATINMLPLQGAYTLGIAYKEKNGGIKLCPQFRIATTVQ